MRLTALVEYIVDLLNDQAASWKPTDYAVIARPSLDWVSEIGQKGFKVLVVPELVQYGVEGQRRKVLSHEQLLFVSILVGHTFEGVAIGTQDVAPWDSIKSIIDARQAIEECIINNDYSSQKVAVAEVEGQPVEELELKDRNFNATTSFGFEAIKCESSAESSSSQITSRPDTESPETRAYIRRAALSARRLGRR